MDTGLASVKFQKKIVFATKDNLLLSYNTFGKFCEPKLITKVSLLNYLLSMKFCQMQDILLIKTHENLFNVKPAIELVRSLSTCFMVVVCMTHDNYKL